MYIPNKRIQLLELNTENFIVCQQFSPHPISYKCEFLEVKFQFTYTSLVLLRPQKHKKKEQNPEMENLDSRKILLEK